MPFVAPTSAFATSDSAIVIHPSRRPTPLSALISWWICLRRTLSAFVHLVSLAADSGRRHAVMVHTVVCLITPISKSLLTVVSLLSRYYPMFHDHVFFPIGQCLLKTNNR